MKQVLIGGGGALLARMPAPAVAPGSVLVRVRYSLISTGTELASLRPIASSIAGGTRLEQAAQLSSTAAFYLGKAVKNPGKAAERVKQIVSSYAHQKASGMVPDVLKKTVTQKTSPGPLEPVLWQRGAAAEFSVTKSKLALTGDASNGAYQATSQTISVAKGQIVALTLEGVLEHASLGLGLLNHDQSAWLTLLTLEPGEIRDTYLFDVPEGNDQVMLVIANSGGDQPARLELTVSQVRVNPPDGTDLPASEMGQQGWNVGYSAAGEVIAVGEGVSDFALGDLVACGGAGQANHAEYITVKRNLVARVPQGCSLKSAATTTVGAIAMQGVRRADVRLGEIVCVIGLGLIGMITVQLLRASGCRVIGMDINEERVRKAREMGIEAATNDNDELAAMVRDMTAGHGVDQTLITAATKSNSLINMAMELTRRKGRVIIVGDIGLKPERAQFYRKEIDVLMSTSYGPGRYDPVYEDQGQDYPYAYVRWTQNRNMTSYLELEARGEIEIESLIEQIVPIDDAPQAYKELASSAETPPLAVLLEYNIREKAEEEASGKHKITLRGHAASQSDKINYALVGAGAFGTAMLVPQMDKRNDRYFLKAVVSRDPVRGGNFARSRRVEMLVTEFDEVLRDDSIDMVVIATRHSDHANQTCAALKAGKAVFVEKPLALNWKELDTVRVAYEKAAEGAVLMVGFNRRFAPSVRKLQETLKDRRSPLIINYRLNGGFIPPDHWIQSREGGGRNIGEACHMYDLFRSFSRSSVKTIDASAINPGESAYLRNDNFIATMTYEDGSVGNLVYTALGPKTGMPKERIEVFCDGEAYIIDDFKSLIRCSTEEVLWHSKTADKGHFEELSLLGDAIATNGVPPISFDEIIETTAVSLHIEDMLFGRVGE